MDNSANVNVIIVRISVRVGILGVAIRQIKIDQQ